tara:strand:- start:240 stop:1088 length:849 start_codon:yes stop_codon:yes gene_type:complete
MNITEEFNNLKININLDKLTDIAKNAAIIGSDIISSNYNKIQRISSKGREGDLVTNVDIEVETKIKDYLIDQTPEISILAEESGSLNKSSDLMWCIDPLDGTTNYSHGYPFFGSSIGLVAKGIPILGAISVPYLNELYWGCLTKGSYCNNELIKVSSPINLSESLLVTGFAYDRFETENNNYAEFCWLTHKTRGVRRGGAAAVDLAFVAAGKVDGFWERGLQIWDIAAGAIIVYEAGGIISNYPNGELDLNSGKILACSPKINNELKEQLSQVKPFKRNIYT